MAGDHDGETLVSNREDELLSEIKLAMRSRIAYFKEQADSLTLEGVRRVLEKDLKLEVHALDVHKGFIKRFLSECIEESGDENASKSSGETEENDICTTKVESESPVDPAPKKDLEESRSEEEGKQEDSTVLGLMPGQKTKKVETGENRGNNKKDVLSESMIKKAIRKREAYVRSNAETITMVGVRRLLEEDLKLDTHTLDPYKKFISGQIDMILKAFEESESAKTKTMKAKSRKASKDDSSQESSHSSDGESEEEEDVVKPKKRIATKRKTNNPEGIKKRKMTEKEEKTSKKRMKQADNLAVDGSDEEHDGKNSEGSHSQSSTEKAAKKKDVPTPAYGKRVEHLKSIIKSCGMSVPPSIYKKAKQAPENKREASLIKELEEILSREGLSSNPSEKDIKEVKRKKDRARELEGIDMSNIVSSSRRRSTTSFIPPPKPKIPVESESDESEKSDEESNSDEENSDENNDASHSDDANDDEEENEVGKDDDDEESE